MGQLCCCCKKKKEMTESQILQEMGYRPSKRMIELMGQENTVRMIYGDLFNNAQSIV